MIFYINKKKSYLNDLIELEKKSHYDKLINSSKNKSKTTWRLVKGVNSDPKTRLEIVHDNRLITDQGELSNLFGNYFSTIVEKKLHLHFAGGLSQSCTVSGTGAQGSMFFTPVTPDEVRAVIRALPNGRSVGCDDIPAIFIKRCADVLAEVLAPVINASVCCGQFPDTLKTALVVPIPKKGNSHDIANYRPVALLSSVSKLIEKIIADRIYNFLEHHKLFNRSQHGFRRSHSTETATIELIQYVNDKLDKNKIVVSVFFDLSQAFDTLHSEFVLEKIARLGLRGHLNKWIGSYLKTRSFIVRVGQTWSDICSMKLGTPQGSVLGPLIFLLYVNDLPDHISEGRTFAFADDTTIVVSGVDSDEVCRRIATVVQEFKSWCDSNRLIINIQKTVFMKFRAALHRNKFSLNIPGIQNGLSDSVRFLGAVLDSELNWQQHIDALAKRLNSSYYAISSLKNKFSLHTLISIYYANFYSHLSYGIVVWGLSPHAGRLFVLQKRVIRLMFSLAYRESCRDVFKRYGILTTPCIFLYKILVFIHLRKNNFYTHSDFHNYETRNRYNICLDSHVHSYYKKSPQYAGSWLYNLLPVGLKNTVQIHCFKRALRAFLSSNCFYSVSEYVGRLTNCDRL